MSTTSLIANEVMSRVASLMNDTAQTVYTETAVLPYLNMAIDKLMEELELSNSSPTLNTAAYITVTAGQNKITPVENEILPHYPFDLIEIVQISERLAGADNDPFIGLSRRNFITPVPASNALSVWAWIDQIIHFNPEGSTSDREIKLDYVRQPLLLAQNGNSPIGIIGARSYLSFKTAAYCSMFIGENETRAAALDGEAEKALDLLIGRSSKGRQQIFTRRRPFRSSYKTLVY